jgi:type I restriction enzyme S subunit
MTLNLSDVEGMQVACPTDPDEAEEIVGVLEAMEQKITVHRRRRLLLGELFESLLREIMSGDIVIESIVGAPLPELVGGAA